MLTAASNVISYDIPVTSNAAKLCHVDRFGCLISVRLMANINHFKHSLNCGTGLTQAMTCRSEFHPRVCIEHYNTGQTCHTFSLANLTLTSEYRLVCLQQTGSVGEDRGEHAGVSSHRRAGGLSRASRGTGPNKRGETTAIRASSYTNTVHNIIYKNK